MANTIITKNSATATAVPTAGQLVQGELAVNVTDKRLFTENSGGTEQMRLTSTGLGIGTSSPDYKLDVNGTSNFSGNMNLTATSNINWNGGDVAISNSGTNLVFKTYSGSLAERARLDSSGNLGLGVTPSAWGVSFRCPPQKPTIMQGLNTITTSKAMETIYI
jgi:hypothetical protein